MKIIYVKLNKINMPNKKKGKSSKQYYDENPESKKKKQAYQKEYNKRPEQRKKRSELVKENRNAQKSGRGSVGDGKDYDHATGRMVGASTNRGRNSKNSSKTTKGDRRARG